MTRWLTQGGMEGDGEIVVAAPHGNVRLPVTDGAFPWPDGLGEPHSSFRPASPTPRARERHRDAARARIEAEQRRLAAELAALTADAQPGAPAPAAAPVAARTLLERVRAAHGADLGDSEDDGDDRDDGDAGPVAAVPAVPGRATGRRRRR